MVSFLSARFICSGQTCETLATAVASIHLRGLDRQRVFFATYGTDTSNFTTSPLLPALANLYIIKATFVLLAAPVSALQYNRQFHPFLQPNPKWDRQRLSGCGHARTAPHPAEESFYGCSSLCLIVSLFVTKCLPF